MSAARTNAYETASEAAPELVDVPAAIVCALCGSAECQGCADEPEAKTSSGVVVFVPWERGGGIAARLWSTTRASTDGAEAFFAAMPDGPVAPAVGFAILAEAIAVGSSVLAFVAGILALAYVVLPEATSIVLGDEALRARGGRAIAAAWVAFVGVLVGAHALHGATLDAFARREGAPGALRRSLRFGLYAAGWDVVTSPFGIAAGLLARGPRSLADARAHAFRTPGRATAAALRGILGVSGDAAKRVRVRSMTVTMIASTLAILAAFAVTFAAAR